MMQENDDRVLAYKLAKEVDLKELDEVSGGSLDRTAGTTGVPPGDFGLDTRADW